MSEVRPRLPLHFEHYIKQLKTLSETDLKRLFGQHESDFFKVLVFSDVHGVFVDKKVFHCLLSIVKRNYFDEIVDNGDTIDLPYISRHTRQIRRFNDKSDILRNYTEIGEIEFTKNNILKPLREAADNSVKIIKRDGNHDERITKPGSFTKDQLERLAELYLAYDSTNLGKILDLETIGIEYDPSTERRYFNMFSVVHGLSLSKNAPIKNMAEYLSSGTSGHTHRLNSNYSTRRGKYLTWLESGCIRLKEEVEYIPTAKTPDWQNGFITATFDLRHEEPIIYAETHVINEGECYFNGNLYSWKDKI